MSIFEFEALNDQSEPELVAMLTKMANLSSEDRQAICDQAAGWVRSIREGDETGLMESFLAEYGLSTDEGIALMCLAEALLRVPDKDTMDALIEDKIAPSDWGSHLGQSSSSLVNASTWALMFTGRVLDDEQSGVVGSLRGAIKRLGEPVIRRAVSQAMKEMGRQFVLGQTIEDAMTRAKKREAKGYTYSYDMLGEAAKTGADAERYFKAYADAIDSIGKAASHDDIRENPGISVKLSALHPRYELLKKEDVLSELTPKLLDLSLKAKNANIGLNVDAEEAERLTLSLEVIEEVLANDALKGWDGFGVVVQAYGRRASGVLDWLYALANKHDRKIMVRLVKGAYWDREIKRSQQFGLKNFPVFSAKAATDISYIANARKLLDMTDRIYPQFATHNAHSVAAILAMKTDKSVFEFQRLHGMGEALHELVKKDADTRCRIYAPVGAHRDLLAYLVRRLLENGANSSFVNQIVDETIPAEMVVRDPFEVIKEGYPPIKTGADLFEPERENSLGFDILDEREIERIRADRAPFETTRWSATPLLGCDFEGGEVLKSLNPSDPKDMIGDVIYASDTDVANAHNAAKPWDAPLKTRREVLERAAELYEENYAEIFALLTREAGKTIADAVAELREAVDFLRYYAANATDAGARGRFVCISPWNFPLAIFSGQIAAALAEGNAVLAKPAEQTPLIADFAVRLLHQAGVPKAALQLLPGLGRETGSALLRDARVAGVCFTGSTQTALNIRANMAEHLPAGTPFIAETGGLNAMIVDSTALLEQAVTAIVESAFQSAGQRCSALRCLYVQEDIAERLLEMLMGTVEVFRLGNPLAFDVDCGPVIDRAAQKTILDHIESARADGRLIYQAEAPKDGIFVPPTIIKLSSIAEMKREIFGPVLHIVTFKSRELDKVVSDINATGYGLTFGLQTRIDDRVQEIVDKVDAGNIYVNRNQIGAIVGSQPFGGEGLSGTGPKAGGPNYLPRFCANTPNRSDEKWEGAQDLKTLQDQLTRFEAQDPIETRSMPGPTGESNRLSLIARAPLLCMGPGAQVAMAQADLVTKLGGQAIRCEGLLDAEALIDLKGFSGAIWWGDDDQAKAYEHALSKREGPILPLITGNPDMGHVFHERHVCVDTTASGGNAQLLAEMS